MGGESEIPFTLRYTLRVTYPGELRVTRGEERWAMF